MTEISDCKFCGRTADLVPDIRNGKWYVHCPGCRMQAPHHALKTKAISIWNSMGFKEYEEGGE
jgi:hypothetical protein